MTEWKILVVDDEEDMLVATRFLLDGLVVNGVGLNIQTATSAKQAEAMLKEQRDFAVLIADISMEEPLSGLHLVNKVRTGLGIDMLRIILRTGVSVENIRKIAVDDYEINDYVEKNNSNNWRLKTAVVTALRAYQQLQNYNKIKTAMAGILASSQELLGSDNHKQFAIASLKSCQSALGSNTQFVFGFAGDRDASGHLFLTVLATGEEHEALLDGFEDICAHPGPLCDVRLSMNAALEGRTSSDSEFSKTIFLPIDANTKLVLWIGKREGFDKTESEIVGYLTHTIQVDFGRLVMMRRRMNEVTISMGILAHEFRTPIASLKIATEFMEESLNDAVVPRAKFTKLLSNSSEILRRLTMHIDQSIENVRVALGDKVTVPLKEVNISQLLKSLLDVYQLAFSGMSITQNISPGIIALVDAPLLEQAVINILSNAQKALVSRKKCTSCAKIEISLHVGDAGYAVLAIKDNGSGIPPENVKRIFEPFFTSSNTPAHGLGLTMVKKSIVGMGGTIECKSEPGVGTEFVMRLRTSEK
jgi:signal transduction histidine kinase/CheY-like chemotaxis protein